MEYCEFRAMNSDILLAAEGEPTAVARGFAEAREFIEAQEARFTRFSEASELAQLNRSGGWFRASPDLFEVVRQACAFSEQTGGLFDPTILGALEHAGYDRSMDEVRAYGASPRAGQPDATAGVRGIRLDPATTAIRLPPGVRIDLGGIVKGWIAERAALLLGERAHACAVNAGGDMFMVGAPQGEAAWPLALEHPEDGERALALLRVGPGAVATSATTRRRWQQGEQTRHHLIDPRSGAPAETDLLSVTVIAPHAATAEVFAKALLIAGARAARQVAARCDQPIIFIAVDREGRMWGSPEAMEVMYVEAEFC